ncbi:AAA family ATPase [Solibaculum mannosilyticum]|uniref:AAA family ATPase n=1 Tax=Solibaculum mannosilyticum TaxID=2780922 RepID=UPI0007A7E54A|nr:hypothetical protein BN3661_00448 [Eubacteriaceae bacterium CHKCI005]
MLVKITLENFKSFDGPVEFTMVSSSKIQGKKDHKVKIKGVQFLKYGVIYGANASGKSNLVDFFSLFKNCVQDGLPVESVEWFCKNKESNKQRESNFEIQFTVDNKFYAYGFSAILSERKITSEWLYELLRDGSAKCLFEREAKQRPVLSETLNISDSDKQRFEIYAEDFEDNETTLFLTEMNRNKKYPVRSKLNFFQKVYSWFRDNLYIIKPDTPLMDLEYYYDDESLDLINRIIHSFDTGIIEVSVDTITLEELQKSLSKPVFEDMMEHIRAKIQGRTVAKMRITMRSNTSFFNISVEGNNEPVVTTIRLHHSKSFYDFRFEDESDGTRRLFDLIDMLLNRRDDVVYIVDELDRSLHPKLTEHYLKKFMDLHRDKQKQLIFTTHEASIMDQALFRRDEIWFVERNGDNASTIYSLDRFKERYDKRLSKAYLEGRYGAIPVFSSFDFGKEE